MMTNDDNDDNDDSVRCTFTSLYSCAGCEPVSVHVQCWIFHQVNQNLWMVIGA